jgi:5-methylcytosine-specific restriction endonuclease McrA
MNAIAISLNGSILNRAVLVLNSNYAPLHVCTTKRAICLYYLDKAEILESYEEAAHSPSTTLSLPSVVKLNKIVHYNSMSVILNRRNIIQRDHHTCQYCGKSSGPVTVDHIIPKERGGLDSWENLTTACPSCNLIKGNRTPGEAGMQLKRQPVRPNRIHYFQQIVRHQQIGWRPYLFMEPLQ